MSQRNSGSHKKKYKTALVKFSCHINCKELQLLWIVWLFSWAVPRKKNPILFTILFLQRRSQDLAWYNLTSWTLCRFKCYASSVSLAMWIVPSDIACQYIQSIKTNCHTRVSLMKEPLQSVNIPVWHKTPLIQWYTALLHGAFYLHMTKRFTKKSAHLFNLGNSDTKRQLKVIKSQILNFVHILSKIGFLLQLLSISSSLWAKSSFFCTYFRCGARHNFPNQNPHCCYSDN